MKVYKFAPPYRPGKTKGSIRATFPETRNHAGVYIAPTGRPTPSRSA